jgi:hypothetical protein
MEQESSDCVDFNLACKALAKNQLVQSLVEQAVGAKDFHAALALMEAGMLDGDIGDTVRDLLSDAITNEWTNVWYGFIHHDHDDYPVSVNEYHGVYWVSCMDYDDVGYFLDKEKAVSFVRLNWENVCEDGEDQT